MEQKELKAVVVLGAGNWVKQQYAKAFQPYRQREECGVFIVYDTGYAATMRFTGAEADRYNQHTLRNVQEFAQWGASCLDLANPTHRQQLMGLSPYVIFVATPDNTHCDMVEQWLEQAENIIVEKPFDIDHERIRRLRNEMTRRRSPAKVWGFDHYLVRANQFVKMKRYLGFDDHLERQIYEFRFHMLESEPRSLEERAASLQTGLVMDMGSHTPALVLPFGDPNTIRLDPVKAGVYKPDPASRQYKRRPASANVWGSRMRSTSRSLVVRIMIGQLGWI
jgi:predicted dehydrogenase